MMDKQNSSGEDKTEWVLTLEEQAARFNPEWIAMRRYLHQNPELSDAEYMTTEYLSSLLGKLGLPTHIPGEGRGVTADLVTSAKLADGPRIAIRGDIDALPIDAREFIEGEVPWKVDGDWGE